MSQCPAQLPWVGPSRGGTQHSWSHCHGAWPLSPHPTPSCRPGTTHRAGERGFCSWGLSWGGMGPPSCCAPQPGLLVVSCATWRGSLGRQQAHVPSPAVGPAGLPLGLGQPPVGAPCCSQTPVSHILPAAPPGLQASASWERWGGSGSLEHVCVRDQGVTQLPPSLHDPRGHPASWSSVFQNHLEELSEACLRPGPRPLAPGPVSSFFSWPQFP